MRIDIERVIHSTKTAVACVIGFLFAKIVGLPADQWVVITIIVVMCAQIYVGSVMSKAYLRLLGTLIGCLFAAITILVFGHNNLSIITVIVVSSLVFSYIATSQENLTYTGTLGAVTTAIIMYSPNPTMITAGERFLEISLGIVIAALVSQFILPIHGRDHLQRAQASTLEKLRDFYIAAMIARSIDSQEAYQDLDENIAKSLLRQRALAKDSVREPFQKAFDKDHFMQTLYCERDILRAISFLHHALIHIDDAKITLAKLASLHTFNESILQAFNTITNAIRSDKVSKPLKLPNLNLLKKDFMEQIETPNRENLVYVDGLLFSAEILTGSMAKLAGLYEIAIEV